MKGEVLQLAYLSGPSNHLFPKAVRPVLSEPLASACNTVVCRYGAYIISTAFSKLGFFASFRNYVVFILKMGRLSVKWERGEYPLSTVWVRCQGGVCRDTCFVPFLPV